MTASSVFRFTAEASLARPVRTVRRHHYGGNARLGAGPTRRVVPAQTRREEERQSCRCRLKSNPDGSKACVVRKDDCNPGKTPVCDFQGTKCDCFCGKP